MLEKKINLKAGKVGSALIMTVVLVVLLSIVAVMFVMVARMDSASTSNIVDSKTLDNAALSIIEIIGKELVFDTPGVAKNAGLADPNYLDYQDYPDVNDAWLANIEPYNDNSTYRWRQISDVTGYLKSSSATKKSFATRGVKVEPSSSTVIKEYPDINLNADNELKEGGQTDGINNNEYRGQPADADGDGIADSKWIELDDISSSKGKPVYAAIRVIDNCAMLNVNTAYKFDANTADTNDIRYKIDGTNQMQINLAGILKGNDDIKKFHNVRCGVDAGNEYYNKTEQGWNDYKRNVIWDYGFVPDGNYLPFDISDELELRYRYCVDSKFTSRLESDANISKTMDTAGEDGDDLYDGSTDWGLHDWQTRITDTNNTGDGDRHHLLTTYSFDRLIDPDGNKMFNVRSDRNAQLLYNRLIGGIENWLPDTSKNEIADSIKYYLAQIAANIVDYSDSDSNVSVVSACGKDFYGYEPPFMFISEIARYFDISGSQPGDPNIYKSYAIELYKNFDKSQSFNGDWQLIVPTNAGTKIIGLSSEDFNSQGGQYYVYILNNKKIDYRQFGTSYTDSPANGAENVSPNVVLSWPIFRILDANGDSHDATDYKLYLGKKGGTLDLHPTGSSRKFKPGILISEDGVYQWYVVGSYGSLEKTRGTWEFTVKNPQPKVENDVPDDINLVQGTLIELQRRNVGGSWITVDRVAVPDGDFVNETILKSRSYQRDMRWNVYLKGLWTPGNALQKLTLGHRNEYNNSSAHAIPPWHHSFTTVGDAAMVFRASTYLPAGTPRIMITDNALLDESRFRFDVNCPSMQNVFKYITALPPDGVPIDTKGRVRGRININTAPAYVIARLPWVSSKITNTDLKIADAIVAYRDKAQLKAPNGSILLDYSNRQSMTGIPNIYEAPGFRSVGELLTVVTRPFGKGGSNSHYNIRYCGIDGQLQSGYPGLYDNELLYDYDPNGNLSDTNIADDLEEKEVIFARISDLATVRSDTFTAYILVRVGVNGPQKRFIAILDRKDVNKDNYATEKVKVAAFQQVPAAR